MKFNILSDTFLNKPNTHLFNSTRKFFGKAGIEYTADMKKYCIYVNNKSGAAFSLKFDSYNYIRVRKIPSGKFEYLFIATCPEYILKKLFDYRIMHFTEINWIMQAVNKTDEKPDKSEVVVLDHKKKSKYDNM